MKPSIITNQPLSPAIQGLRPSATLLINERSKALMNEGKKVYRLGFGQSPFPVPVEVVQALKDNAHQKDYLPVRGLPALCEAVAAFNKRTIGIDCKADQVMIGPGSKELIFSLQMAFNGDLLLPSPSWVSYEPQANMLNKKTWWIETKESDGWKLKPSAIDQICSRVSNPQKLLILNYPNNPVGNTYSTHELKSIADACRRNNILVVADEIYGEVHHNGNHISIATFYPEGTIISSGLSKWCGAGGWRLGTFIFPKKYQYLQSAITTIASETFSSVSAPIQYASIIAFHGSEAIENYIFKSRQILKTVGEHVYQCLSDLDITMPAPEGGFYLFPNFNYHKENFLKRGIEDSPTLCERLLNETGVALLPGTAFGRPASELTARLSFVDFDGAKALQLYNSQNSLQQFNPEHFPNIYQAMNQIKNWIYQ